MTLGGRTVRAGRLSTGRIRTHSQALAPTFDKMDRKVMHSYGHASEAEFFDSPDFWEENEVETNEVERSLSLASNRYNFNITSLEGLEVHDRDLSTILSQDDAELHLNGPALSGKAPSNITNSKSSVDDNIRQFTCKCTRQCSFNQKSEADGSLQLYENLPSEDAFRVIEVQPGLHDDPVVCRLHVALISEAILSYATLSYTWKLDDEAAYRRRYMRPTEEEALPKVPISCNDFEVLIGENLFQAIKRIRKPSISQMLWADALCINQNDVQERTQQVRKMSTIYKNAFRLFVWLGENDRPYSRDTHSLAFPGLCRIINRWREREGHSARVPPATYSFLAPEQTYSTPDEPLAADDAIWSDILHFYNRKWFRRLWVIQEVALARSAVALWGGYEIDWEWIGLAAAIIRTNYPRLTALRRISQRVGSYEIKTSLNPRAVPTGIINAYFMYRISRSQVYFKAPRFSFHQLLTLTRQFRCEDPRDKVFGILGIPTVDQPSAQETPFILPDYTKSVAEVCHEVAIKIIDISGSLGLLSSVQQDRECQMAHSDRRNDHDPSLPSWVPQWRCAITETLTPLEPSANFDPSGGQCMQRKQAHNAKILVVRGIDVEMVSTVAGEPLDFSRRSGLMSYLEGPYKFDELQTSHYTLSDLEDLSFTLTAGKDWYGLPVPNASNHLADFSKCLLENGLLRSLKGAAFGVNDNSSTQQPSNIVPSSTPGAPNSGFSDSSFATEETLRRLARNGRADRFLDTAATAGKRRTLFTTASGLRGIGPETMNCEDRVCILYGANVPFILRRQVETDAYTVIGECYIHKLMHGEILRRLLEPGTELRETWIKLI
ncbi:heterokaryon incompatibility protein-domain-containing protein [Xylaria telfairii]|nr:heterokaryon incompatibility protein-domain-containing protein [Xylaria telfairii]